MKKNNYNSIDSIIAVFEKNSDYFIQEFIDGHFTDVQGSEDNQSIKELRDLHDRVCHGLKKEYTKLIDFYNSCRLNENMQSFNEREILQLLKNYKEEISLYCNNEKFEENSNDIDVCTKEKKIESDRLYPNFKRYKCCVLFRIATLLSKQSGKPDLFSEDKDKNEYKKQNNNLCYWYNDLIKTVESKCLYDNIIKRISDFINRNRFIFLNGDGTSVYSLISEKKERLCLTIKGRSFGSPYIMNNECVLHCNYPHVYLHIRKNNSFIVSIDEIVDFYRHKSMLNLDFMGEYKNKYYFSANFNYEGLAHDLYDSEGNKIINLPSDTFIDHFVQGFVVVVRRINRYNVYGIYDINGNCILPCKYNFTETFSSNSCMWGNPLHLEDGMFRLYHSIENFEEFAHSNCSILPQFQSTKAYFDPCTKTFTDCNHRVFNIQNLRVVNFLLNEFDVFCGDKFVKHVCIPNEIDITYGQEGVHHETKNGHPNFYIEIIGSNTILLRNYNSRNKKIGEHLINIAKHHVIMGGSEYEFKIINKDYISVGISYKENGVTNRKYGVIKVGGEIVIPIEYKEPFLPFFIFNGSSSYVKDALSFGGVPSTSNTNFKSEDTIFHDVIQHEYFYETFINGEIADYGSIASRGSIYPINNVINFQSRSKDYNSNTSIKVNIYYVSTNGYKVIVSEWSDISKNDYLIYASEYKLTISIQFTIKDSKDLPSLKCSYFCHKIYNNSDNNNSDNDFNPYDYVGIYT